MLLKKYSWDIQEWNLSFLDSLQKKEVFSMSKLLNISINWMIQILLIAGEAEESLEIDFFNFLLFLAIYLLLFIWMEIFCWTRFTNSCNNHFSKRIWTFAFSIISQNMQNRNRLLKDLNSIMWLRWEAHTQCIILF